MSGKLAWTNEEIVRYYRQAKDKAGIIPILADLNATKPSRIRRVLINAGIMQESKRKKELSKKMCTKRSTEGFAPHHSIMLEFDGVRYTMAQVAEAIGRSRSYIARRCREDVCCIGEKTYRVIRFERMG